MKQESPPHSPALSLQNKLDQISHDRDVLHLMRDLARSGLREGDLVRHVVNGRVGRLSIARQDDPPRVLVALENGGHEVFASDIWRRG
ncbi:MAG: hypothetical protein ACK53M_05745 [Betaproteobacteria bacterium]